MPRQWEKVGMPKYAISRHVLMTALLIVVACGCSKPEQKLKLAVFIPERATTFAEIIKPWVDAINAEGKGILHIDAFTGGVLGSNPTAQPDLVVDGVADMAFVIPAYSPGRFPDNEVMELPGILRNSTESSVAFRRLYDRGLLRGYDEFYPALLATTNPYAIHTKQRVRGFADLKGLKLRAGGPVAGESMRALDVAPVGMPITQVAENISKGVIDGTGGDWDVMYSFRIIETAHQHFMVSLGTVPVALLMNRKIYENLTAEARAVLDRHSGEAFSRRFGQVHDGVQQSKLIETQADALHTVVMPTSEQQSELNKIMTPVIESWTQQHPNGANLLAALREELQELRATGQ